MTPHAQTYTHSRLDPRVEPFSGYIPEPITPPSSSQVHSSPPLTQATSNSYGSGTGTGPRPTTSIDNGNVNHTPTPFPYTIVHPPAHKVQPVKEFGHGWSSSSFPLGGTVGGGGVSGNRAPTSASISITEPAPDPIIIPSRARSPSVPFLPSEAHFAQLQGNSNGNGKDHNKDRNQSLAQVLQRKQSTGQVPFPTTNYAPPTTSMSLRRYSSQTPTLLNNYPSTPKLTLDNDREYMTTSSPALRTKFSYSNVNSWRQGVMGDAMEEEGDEHVPQSSLLTPTLYPSRSVPGLGQTVGRLNPTLAPEFAQSRNSMSLHLFFPPLSTFHLSRNLTQ